jgi:hypothetical protein
VKEIRKAYERLKNIFLEISNSAVAAVRAIESTRSERGAYPKRAKKGRKKNIGG